MKIGFMSTHTNEEENRLLNAGCETIVVSETPDSLEAFRNCLTVNKGKTVVISDLRSISPTINTVQIAHLLNNEELATLIVLDHGTSEPVSNRTFLEVVKHLGNLEITTTKNKTLKGLEDARSRGVELGRPKTSPDVVKQIQFLYHSQRKSFREIAETCNVSLGTAYKYSINS